MLNTVKRNYYQHIEYSNFISVPFLFHNKRDVSIHLKLTLSKT